MHSLTELIEEKLQNRAFLGYADMAVSNAIGSNIFDVLICLGIPWFLQTAVIGAENYAKVYSKGIYKLCFKMNAVNY